MITKNGLSLFRALLSSTAIKPTDLTNTNGRSDIITEKTVSGVYVDNTDGVSLSESWITGNGTFYNEFPIFYTRGSLYMNDYLSFTNNAGTNKDDIMSTILQTYINTTLNNNTATHYFAPTEQTLTIPINQNVNTITRLATLTVPVGRYLGRFSMTANNYSNFNARDIMTRGVIWGIPPHANNEYITISYPAAFNTSHTFQGSLQLLGMNNNFVLNLGYSSDAESVDDYDLSSPVYNKKLSPIQFKVENANSKLVFTCTFKNYETESITVGEFGIYSLFVTDQARAPIYPDNIRTLESGRYLVSDYRYGNNPMTNEYICGASQSPYLIARKVLPQAVTIPPDGVATFKYTIDLSEMKAQENITYSEEE